MIKFFIVTPSYNQAEFLEKTIKSVISQKGDFSLEYWVLDGGSTDGSVEILERHADQLNWRSQKDEGQVDAINQGLEIMKAQLNASEINSEQTIFSYLNSDDVLEPGAFQTIAEQFKQNPEKDWLVGDARIINAQGKEIQRTIRHYKKFMRRLWLVCRNLIYLLNPIPQPATFIRASLADSIGEFNQQLDYAMDYQYWLEAFQKAGYPLIIHQPLAEFRIHASTKGTTGFRVQFEEELEVAESYCQQPLLLKLHQLHNQLVYFIYQLIK